MTMTNTTTETNPQGAMPPQADPWGTSLPSISRRAIRAALHLLNDAASAYTSDEDVLLSRRDLRGVAELLLLGDAAAGVCRLHLKRLDDSLDSLQSAVCCVDEDSIPQLRDAVTEAEDAHLSAESEIANIQTPDLLSAAMAAGLYGREEEQEDSDV
jgi:hypothetical protein